MNSKTKMGIILGIAITVSVVAIFGIFPGSITTERDIEPKDGSTTSSPEKNIVVNLNENVELKDTQ